MSTICYFFPFKLKTRKFKTFFWRRGAGHIFSRERFGLQQVEVSDLESPTNTLSSIATQSTWRFSIKKKNCFGRNYEQRSVYKVRYLRKWT